MKHNNICTSARLLVGSTSMSKYAAASMTNRYCSFLNLALCGVIVPLNRITHMHCEVVTAQV